METRGHVNVNIIKLMDINQHQSTCDDADNTDDDVDFQQGHNMSVSILICYK